MSDYTPTPAELALRTWVLAALQENFDTVAVYYLHDNKPEQVEPRIEVGEIASRQLGTKAKRLKDVAGTAPGLFAQAESLFREGTAQLQIVGQAHAVLREEIEFAVDEQQAASRFAVINISSIDDAEFAEVISRQRSILEVRWRRTAERIHDEEDLRIAKTTIEVEDGTGTVTQDVIVSAP